MRDSFFEKYKTSEVTNTRRVINTPSAFTREHFFLYPGGRVFKSLKPHMSRRSGLQSYLFLIVLSGSGEVAYRDTAKPVPAAGSDMGRRSGTSAAGDGGNGSLATVHAKAGDCFFLDCRNEYTHISSEDDPWELMWIHFYGPQCDAYYDYFSQTADVAFSHGAPGRADRLQSSQSSAFTRSRPTTPTF